MVNIYKMNFHFNILDILTQLGFPIQIDNINYSNLIYHINFVISINNINNIMNDILKIQQEILIYHSELNKIKEEYNNQLLKLSLKKDNLLLKKNKILSNKNDIYYYSNLSEIDYEIWNLQNDIDNINILYMDKIEKTIKDVDILKNTFETLLKKKYLLESLQKNLELLEIYYDDVYSTEYLFGDINKQILNYQSEFQYYKLFT
jgi:hypothetical protein